MRGGKKGRAERGGIEWGRRERERGEGKERGEREREREKEEGKGRGRGKEGESGAEVKDSKSYPYKGLFSSTIHVFEIKHYPFPLIFRMVLELVVDLSLVRNQSRVCPS